MEWMEAHPHLHPDNYPDHLHSGLVEEYSKEHLAATIVEDQGPFLGLGSPQALEQAIKATESDDFQVFERLAYALVCSPLPQEEVVARMARRISGTSAGWVLAEWTKKEPNPCGCSDKPGHSHYLFEC